MEDPLMEDIVQEEVEAEADLEIETKFQPLLLAKEELAIAQCCRLCARGAKLLNAEDNPNCTFHPLFDDDNVLQNLDQSVPLHHLINKYLPIEILQTDSSYPKVICSVCIELVKKTVEFFNVICEGQRLLAKILNYTVNDKLDVLAFSENNPLSKAPKRRGRPRKKGSLETPLIKIKRVSSGEGKKKIEVTAPSVAPEITERRTKRQSRPPARYADEVTFKFESEDLLNEEFQFDTPSERITNLPIEGSETKPLRSSLEATLSSPQQYILGLEKLEIPIEIHKEAKKTNTVFSETYDTSVVDGSNTIPSSQHRSPVIKNVQSNASTSVLNNIKKPVQKRKKGKNLKRKITRKIQCEQCPKTFNHTSSLVYHRLSVHDQTKNFFCNICGRAFAHKQLLNNHLYIHADEKYFVCESCPAKFKSRASLYTHKKCRHSGVREHTCEVCGMQFTLKSSLVGHIRLHTGEKPFHCEFCEKKFAQRSSLREHRRTHTGEKPYHCSECSKSFTTASQLRSHKFCHTNDKVHLCQICGKGFSHAENFKYHMRRHNSEYPVQCPVCSKKFSETWTFKKHFRLHSGEKPYHCNVCDKVFSDPSNFAKHKKTHVTETTVSDTNLETQSIHEYLIPCNSINGENLIDAVIASNDVAMTGAELVSVTAEDNDNFVANGTTSSIVQILNSDNLTYQTISEGDQDLGQVIYVYSGDGPLFTFTMTDDQQASVTSTEDGTIANVDVGALETTLESFNPNDDHYYSLETIGDSTVAVPIQMPLSRHTRGPSGVLNASHNPRVLSGRVAIEVDNLHLLNKTCDTETS